MSKLVEDLHVWAGDIVKAQEREDGTIDVYGAATSTRLDIDHEICDPIWLKKAMPDWFEWGNIREMHQPKAVGTASELTEADDTYFIKANIVDPDAVTKVKSGTYKGFSVGIHRPRKVVDKAASNGRIVDGIIAEVSLCDRPVNPDCTLTIAKTVGTEIVHVEELAEKAPMASRAADILKVAGDWTHDPTLLASVRDGLASLMQAELVELQAGENEISDLYQLLNALQSFLSWWADEAREGEDPKPFNDSNDQMGAILMAVAADSTVPPAVADLTKALGAFVGKNVDQLEAPAVETQTPPFPSAVVPTPVTTEPAPVVPTPAAAVTPPVVPTPPTTEPIVAPPEGVVTESAAAPTAAAPKPEVTPTPTTETDAPKDVVEELKAVKAALADVSEQLVQVKAMAAPGGPSRMGDPNAQARITKAAELTAKRDKYLAIAEKTGDRLAAKGYRELAADVEQELDVINKSA